MLNGMHENQGTPMPSPGNTSVNEEPKTSSPYIRRTREEGRAMIARYEEFGDRFVQYMKDNNLLPKPCPAPKLD